MKKVIILLFFFVIVAQVQAEEKFFTTQSIDTMKYSRDRAREKLKDMSYDTEIDAQVKNIAETGATHVGIGTPYDIEFTPYLARWVAAARRYNLKVWFRGNFSGWEGWFNYPKISRDTHTQKTRGFILSNSNLFEDGDIFTSCPECENGGPGDPRQTQDVAGFRQFLITENTVSQEAFKSINKKVITNYYSMNGDVARLIMNPQTTKALNNAVVVDHYVKTPEQLQSDIRKYVAESQGLVVLGEFGAPIPDIHGNMTEDEQAAWIDTALEKVLETKSVHVINYWVNRDSSTAIWNDDNSPRKAVDVLQKYFKPQVMSGRLTDDFNKPVANVRVETKYMTVFTDNSGKYKIPMISPDKLRFSKEDYIDKELSVDSNISINRDIIFNRSRITLWERFLYELEKLAIYIKSLLGFKAEKINSPVD